MKKIFSKNTYHKLTLIFTLNILLIAGCASVPLAAPEADKKAKKFSPPANMSYVYIFRDSAGVPHEMVEINGKMIGGLSNQTYFLMELEPAEYKIRVGTKEAYDNEATGNVSSWLTLGTATVDLLTLPGHMYFIRVEMPLTRGGPSAVLTVLPVGKGKEYILSFNRAKT